MKCNCGYKIDYKKPKGSYALIDIKKESGFYPILTGVGSIIWICPTCADKCVNLAKEIYKLLPEEYVYLYQLVKIKD